MSWQLSCSYERHGSGKGEFDYARGITVSNKTGNVIVADISNKRIQVLNQKLEYVFDWTIDINGSCLCPLDVHRVNESNVAAIIEGHATLWQCPDITDFSSHKIRLLHSFGNKDLVFPRSITTMNENYVISDVGQHRVLLYNQEGKFLAYTGSLGNEDATNFNWPYYTCTDDKGRLAVSDSHNRCIKLFDRDLNFISCFGKDVLTCCAGVAFDSDQGGSFYAIEYDNQSLFQFSVDGKLIRCIDENMKYPGQGLVVSNSKKIFCSMHYGFFVYSKK